MAPPVVKQGLDAEELVRLLHALLQPTALIEIGVIVGCLALAWLVVRLVRGPEARRGSIWFGHGVVDGIFFPVLALLLVLFARWALKTWVPLAVFKLAVPVLLSLAVIRLTVRVLHASFPDSKLVRVVERSVSWVVWLGVVLWITGLLPLLLQELDSIQWKIGSTQISVRNILEGAVSAVLVLVGALWLSSMLEARLLTGATSNLGVRKMAANSLRALLLFIGLMFALSAAGIDLTALGVLGGALGVGIGFGLQKLAANYVSGFVILAEQSMRIGDLVKVDNFEGRITDISTRYTVIRAINGREAIVPNEMMITQRVENASLADSRMLLNTVVQVAYGTPVDAVMARMRDTVAAVPRVMADPGPGVLLTNFAADGLELTVGFWIADPENGQGNVRSDVNLAILKLFDEMKIEIPFPQRVLRRAAA
ncbi:mechanosensitive ion channel protein [beta proteobacterium AAP121]|nr:mechanosensitive ion channel protein [beta proteobacterium AAP65]KPG00292.1 mechanosensitive ion channel protein [beta proteobacterium AAP121]